MASYGNDEPPQEQVVSLSKFDRKETELLQILLQEPSLLDFAVEKISPDQFREGPLQSIYRQLEESFHTGSEVGYQQLMLELEDPVLKTVVDLLYDEALEKQRTSELAGNLDSQSALQNQMESIILAFQNLATESGNRQAISRLQEREFDEEEELTALEELLKQTRQRQGL